MDTMRRSVTLIIQVMGYMNNMSDIEKEIIEKNLTAPRVTPDSIQNKIKSTQYYVFPGTTFTTALITLENGAHVLGESACVSPENFDEEIGRKVAYQNAVQKVWPLEGDWLKEKLFKESV